MKLAAIDIGSNALRLLFVNVYESPKGPIFKKHDLVRVPLRLGDDAFRDKRISKPKIDKLLLVMRAYKALLDFYEVDGLRACATSAMREAQNGPEVMKLIREHTGIAVEIIDGKTEAQIIYENHVAEDLDPSNDYLYIDVGGGSTELTLFSKNAAVASRSFNVGTIRMLNDLVSKELWAEMKEWSKALAKDRKRPLFAIGSGGNINKIFKMSRKKPGRPLSYDKLKQLLEMLEGYSFEEREKILGLNPDRADVIVPAARIFLMVMKAAGTTNIYVPQIGLADGLIHLLYADRRAKASAAK